MSDPTSPASPGRSDDGVIDRPEEISERMLLILVDGWISAMNRVPKFADVFEETPEKSGGGEDHWTTKTFVGLWGTRRSAFSGVGPEIKISLGDPLAWAKRKLGAWNRRRQLIGEAKKLGVDAKFAKRFTDRFLAIWRSGETAHLARKEQTQRIAELLRQA